MTSEVPLPYKLANLGHLRLRGILNLKRRIKQKVMSTRDQVDRVICEAINKLEIQGAFLTVSPDFQYQNEKPVAATFQEIF